MAEKGAKNDIFYGMRGQQNDCVRWLCGVAEWWLCKVAVKGAIRGTQDG